MRFRRVWVVHVLDGGAAGTTEDTVGSAHDGSLSIVDWTVLISRVCLVVLLLAQRHRVFNWSGMARIVFLLTDGSGSSRRVVVDRVDVVDGYRRVAQVAGTVDSVRSDTLGSRARRLLGQG